MKIRAVTITLFVCLLAVCLPSLMAQTAATGSLQGTVTDASGAVIPNATVTLTSADTGQERTATTGGDGTYRFPLLPPGAYKLKFAANGFKGAEATGIKVNVTESPVFDQKLEVGTATEQVTVEANVETLQTASSSMGTVVGAATATSIPLTTRNYTNLLGLSAGANASVNNASALGRGGMEIAVNGASTAQNTFQMDGVSVVNYRQQRTVYRRCHLSDHRYSEPGYDCGVQNPDLALRRGLRTQPRRQRERGDQIRHQLAARHRL